MTTDDKITVVEFFEFVQKNMTTFRTIKEAWSAFLKLKGK